MSAEKALERILTELHPDYVWTVTRRPNGAQSDRMFSPSLPTKQPGALTDDPDTVNNINTLPTTNLPHDDSLNKAA